MSNDNSTADVDPDAPAEGEPGDDAGAPERNSDPDHGPNQDEGADGSAATESDLADREAAVADRETELDEREGDLEDRKAELAEWEATLDGRERDLDRREDRLDQREDGLDKRAEDLKERAGRLDEREDDLDDVQEQLEAKRDELTEREAAIEQRETELDEREAAIQDREVELSERASELDRKEQTLQEYVGDQVGSLEEGMAGTIRDAVASGMDDYRDSSSRLGTVGNLLLGLVGIALIVGGVVNVLATGLADIPTLLGSTGANTGISAVLVFCGLAANLAAAAGRV